MIRQPNQLHLYFHNLSLSAVTRAIFSLFLVGSTLLRYSSFDVSRSTITSYIRIYILQTPQIAIPILLGQIPACGLFCEEQQIVHISKPSSVHPEIRACRTQINIYIYIRRSVPPQVQVQFPNVCVLCFTIGHEKSAI